MAVNKSFNGTTYSIPTTAGENGWTNLTNFLQALADYAAVKTTTVQAIRTATTSPITVSATSDFGINVALSVAGVSTVTLPVGASGQMFCIIDGNGDSATYNITVQGSSSQTINGASTYTMASNKQVAIFQFNGTEWKVIAEYLGASINATKIGAGSVDNTEFGYLNGVTSAIQTQLNTGATNLTNHEADTSTHGVGEIVGRTETQTLTNKTISTASNTVGPLDSVTGTLSVSKGGTGLTAVGSALQVLRTNAGATALEWATAGSGDVVGPASAVDNAIARFDGTTGKLVQNSSATIDDSGAVTLGPSAGSGSSSLSHTLQADGSVSVFLNTSTHSDASPLLRFRRGGSDRASMGVAGAGAGAIGSTSSPNDFVIYTNTFPFKISTDTGATTALSITTGGAVTLGPSSSTATNCVVNGAASVTHGVVFPASQNAVANANTLDDYEEGTFTPTLAASVTNPTGHTANGRYTKIGNLVHVEVFISWGASGYGSGDYTVGGLPFATAGTHYVTAWGLLFRSGTGWYASNIEIAPGGSSGKMLYTQTNSYVTPTNPNTWNSGSYFKYHFTYRVA